jgi:Bax protein
MFITLNAIIKWMIIFLLIEVLIVSIGSLFEVNLEKKEQKRLETKIIYNSSTLQEEFDRLVATYTSSQLQEGVHQLISTYNPSNSSMKEKKNPFRFVTLRNERDVLVLKSHNVEPICYTNTVSLSKLTIQQKKETFINMMIPSILLAKYKMRLERKKVLILSKKKNLSVEEGFWLYQKKVDFNAETNDELYKNMELHPTSLIIAQAIIESGWGTSKFFQQANNVFGIWSFNKQDQRISASETRGKKRIYLKKYSSIHQSIYDYLLTIGHVSQYKSFREKRLETQDPFTLVKYLDKYSERGKDYVKDIKNIIKSNKLTKYDTYALKL